VPDLNQDLAHRLDRLESRTAIEALAFNYCHGFDKRDFDRFLSIWWDDCVWDIGPPFGRFEGHAGIHEAVKNVLWPAWLQSQHITSNHVIDFESDDRAHAVCDVDCTGLLMGNPEATFVGATYTDVAERRSGTWKIAQRTVTMHYFNSFANTTLTKPETQ
jgi:ketosteroid isomerase-like protein